MGETILKEQVRLLDHKPVQYEGVLMIIGWKGKNTIAEYSESDNRLTVYEQFLKSPDEQRRRTLSHEFSHYLFAHLSKHEQETIVELFIQPHEQNLTKLYKILRRVSPYKEFSLEAWAKHRRSLDRKGIPWGTHYMREMLINFDDKQEKVNATLLVNELIAYHVSKDEDICNMCYGFYMVHPDISVQLTAMGFYNIDVDELMSRILRSEREM